MKTTNAGNTRLRRPLAAAAMIVIGIGAAGCSTDEATDDASSVVADEGVDADPVIDEDTATDGLVGLEVTAVGNVSEVLSDEALRLDRDGLGEDTDEDADADTELGGPYDYYDYDYYDYDYLVEYDEEFEDDDAAQDGVLVVDATGLKSFDEDASVRVSGTVRQFDQDTIESLYEIDLADDTFDEYENQLVIVADTIEAADAPAATTQASATGRSASPTPSES